MPCHYKQVRAIPGVMKKVGLSAKIIYMLLLFCGVNESGGLVFENGETVTAMTISEELSLSIRAVESALRDLRHNKIVERVKAGRSVFYVLNEVELKEEPE